MFKEQDLIDFKRNCISFNEQKILLEERMDEVVNLIIDNIPSLRCMAWTWNLVENKQRNTNGFISSFNKEIDVYDDAFLNKDYFQIELKYILGGECFVIATTEACLPKVLEKIPMRYLWMKNEDILREISD